MKRKLTPIAVSLCVLGFISAPAFAAVSNNNNVAQRTAALEQQVAELQKEIADMKPQANSSSKKKHHHYAQAGNAATTSSSVTSSAPSVKSMPTSGAAYLPVDVDVPGQSFVSSGPYIGVPLEYSGNDLIINNPSIDQDVTLLEMRKNIHQRFQSMGITEDPDHAHVLLSGVVEGQAAYQNTNSGASNSSIDLTRASIDAYILGPSRWLSSLISLSYDNYTGASEGTFNSNTRAVNSRVYVNQAFFTIGDLTQTPFYGTLGQVNVPFGRYSSNMITDPLTKDLGRVKTRAITIGYQPQQDNALYLAGYAFQGDSHVGNTSRVNDGGIDFGYHFKQANYNGDFGGGVLGNLADSLGMQVVGNSAANFNGFGGTSRTGNEKLVHNVPAYDLRGMLGLGTHVDLLAEYVAASTAFNAADMTMNGRPAKPQALNAEAAYTFDSFSKPSSIALDYGMTKNALAIGLPAERYGVVFNTSIWRDTLQSLEFRHDITYSSANTATGSGVLAASEGGMADNAVTAQFDVYF